MMAKVGIPEIEIQAVPERLDNLMRYIEQQTFFDIENRRHREALFRVAEKLSRTKEFREFHRTNEVASKDLSQSHPDVEKYERMRRQVIERIQQNAPKLLAQVTDDAHKKGNRHTVYSDGRMRLTKTEEMRLTDLVRRFDSQGKQTMLVTGSEVGFCINSAMERIHAAAPSIRQIAVDDCCYRKPKTRWDYYPPHALATDSRHLDTHQKIKIYFGMARGETPPEPYKPFNFFGKRI